MADAPATGGCACGALRYELTAPPIRVVHCQCTMCRKMSGSGHATLAFINPETFKLTAGAPSEYSYTADSGNVVTRRFCPVCGSHVYGSNSRSAGMFAVLAGSLDDPSGLQPRIAVYTAQGQPWDHLGEGLATFEAMPPMRG